MELATVLAGPSVGVFFAELGANVVKVENKKTGGDVTRQWKLACEDPTSDLSAYFASINFGKMSVTLDLCDRDERRHFENLCAQSDILLLNLKPGDAEKLSLRYEDLAKVNPKLIYASVSAYGEHDQRVGFDVLLQAETGLISMNGTNSRQRAKLPVAFIDLLAAHQLKEAVLIALLQREKTQSGQAVSVSLFDAAIASLVNQAANTLRSGKAPQPMGTLHPNIAPYGECFRCRDGVEVIVAIGTDTQFTKLCDLLGLADVATHQDYSVNPVRVKNRAALSRIFEKNIANFDSKQLLSACEKRKIPLGVVRSLDEVLREERVRPLMLNAGGELSAVRTVAFESSAYNARELTLGAPPHLGEHQDSVLKCGLKEGK